MQNTFGAGAVATALIWVRNVWGYVQAKAKAKAEGNAEIEYNINKFYQTTAQYLGGVAVVFNVAPTPELRAIGVLVVWVADVLYSAVAKIVPSVNPITTQPSVK